MKTTLISVFLIFPVLGGILAYLVSHKNLRRANQLGLLGSSVGCIIGIGTGLQQLYYTPRDLKFTLPFASPAGVLHFKLDGLCAFFLIVMCFVTGMASLYGFAYLKQHPHQENLTGKACYTIFLGTPRISFSKNLGDPGPGYLLPMGLVAFTCCLLGLFGSLGFSLVVQAVSKTALLTVSDFGSLANDYAGIFHKVSLILFIFLVIGSLLLFLRQKLLSRTAAALAGTWSCGYDRLTPRMQYTGSSFVAPLLQCFNGIICSESKFIRRESLFPQKQSFRTKIHDTFAHRFYEPLFKQTISFLAHLAWIQNGKVRFYAMYIVVTLVLLLTWQLKK